MNSSVIHGDHPEGTRVYEKSYRNSEGVRKGERSETTLKWKLSPIGIRTPAVWNLSVTSIVNSSIQRSFIPHSSSDLYDNIKSASCQTMRIISVLTYTRGLIYKTS